MIDEICFCLVLLLISLIDYGLHWLWFRL